MVLKDKVVVIIGGSQGFGKALAKGLQAEGAQVVIAGRTQAHVDEAARELSVKGFVADTRDETALQTVAETAVKELGGIDIWINSAGVFRNMPEDEPLDMDRAREMFDINFLGTVLGSRIALKHLRADGAIINLLSSAGLDASRAIAGGALYAASKWAVRGYIDAQRAQNADRPIKILSIYPGGMKTYLHNEVIPGIPADFMELDYVVDKVIANLKQAEPELDLIIKRPNAA